MKSWPTFSSTLIRWSWAVTRDTAGDFDGTAEDGADADGCGVLPTGVFLVAEQAVTIANITQTSARRRTKPERPCLLTVPCPTMFTP
ncbi:hypothetical protein Acor_49060 [Acrocarpospora corrugata]|uniref:Uncharacterized protein n=1 Tax=Acrocarpospora corrugata TaxID=35763 RepID=A0A5M3W3M9_9ACTN|nr:hypothetical protein Acor_49060 [Acrocarpospora corrugata]